MANNSRQAVGTPFYRFARVLLAIFSALFYPCRLMNKEADTPAGPLLLICNHQSMMDPVLLAVMLKQYEIHFIGKREITKFPLLKPIVRKLHMIAVSRHMSDLSAMRAAGAVLKDGQVLGIFPEGRRYQGPAMAQMESGVSILAQRHRVPILPVYIAGRPRPFARVRMYIAPLIPYEDLLEEGISKQAGDALTARIQQVYAELEKKYSKKTLTA